MNLYKNLSVGLAFGVAAGGLPIVTGLPALAVAATVGMACGITLGYLNRGPQQPPGPK